MKMRGTPIIRRKLLTSMVQAGVGLSVLGLLGIAAKSKWVDAFLKHKPVGKWPNFHFKDISRQAGIAVTHKKMYLDPKFAPIMPMMASLGAATAAADYNNDGFVDVF